jgi:hypothetical protein
MRTEVAAGGYLRAAAVAVAEREAGAAASLAAAAAAAEAAEVATSASARRISPSIVALDCATPASSTSEGARVEGETGELAAREKEDRRACGGCSDSDA